MENEYDLPEILAGILLTLGESPHEVTPLVDDFFDFCGIPMEIRSDFTFSIILSQAYGLIMRCK